MDQRSLVDAVAQAWRRLPATPVTWIAWSGGADSTALLLLALECKMRGFLNDVRALHVDHGLHPDAGHWARHCRENADRLGVLLQVCRVSVARAQGVEAAAREARYRAFAEVMAPGEGVVTAHHQDDQAETLVLRLMRGAGVAGLASMQAARPFANGWLLRPLLDVPGALLKGWLEERGVSWIDDPMNCDPHLDRIYVRQHVLPLLQARWPAATRLLARAAKHQAQAARALDGMYCAKELTSTALAAMAPAERVPALRAWLRANAVPSPSARKLAEMVRQMAEARRDKNPAIRFGRHCLRRYRGTLYVERDAPNIQPGTRYAWRGEARLELPAGVFWAKRCTGEGLDERLAHSCHAELRFREGGERCRLSGAKTTRSLKSLLQEWGIPPWERQRLPLVYLDGQLAAVPGYAVFHGFGVPPRGIGLRLRWQRYGQAEDTLWG
ncbi:MAG: tRNA lysidine(34) synthetase TilS [Gammaproteobacteria bacterium]|nr:tRNA lysidine(34) synthetase TilS [Gammaproteobacteria bacterium]